MDKKMARVLIYTQANCKLSEKAKQLISSKNVKFIEKDITYDVLLKREMIERTGGKASTPQMFVNGKLVNNFDDLQNELSGNE